MTFVIGKIQSHRTVSMRLKALKSSVNNSSIKNVAMLIEL